MNVKDIMALYNTHERIDIHVPGWGKCADTHVVKSISPDTDGSFISYFNFDARQASRIISQQKSYFSEREKNFEWKVYDSDYPTDIAQRLLNKGFYEEDEESFMVLDLHQNFSIPEEQPLCIEVTDIVGIRDAIEVKQHQLGDDCEGYYRHLVNLKKARPQNIKIYVVYQDGVPVSSAWVTFNSHASPFAGIWGGSTINGYRGRGYYQALLKQRIRDAALAGKRFLMIDASEMSRPIVEKHGFKVIAKTTPYSFKYI